MATKGQILAGAVVATIVGFGGYNVWKKSKKRTTTPPACSPYKWDPVPVSASVNALIDSGMTDRDQIAATVATEHFSYYPGGGTVAFPPTGTPAKGVGCIWQKVLELVDAIIAGREFPVKPWEVINEWTRDEPTPGFMFRVQPDANLSVSAIARKALRAAGIPDEKNANGVYANRLAMQRLLECSPYNDAVYSFAGSGAGLGPDGRGINLNATHADNKQRMMQGRPARRSITGQSAHDGTGGHLPFMWIPLIEQGAPVPVVANWADGRSGINPPVEILAFGLENVQPGIYGCNESGESASELPIA